MNGVRNTILKMKGLQTRQFVGGGTINSTTGGRGYNTFAMGDALTFTTRLGITSSGSDEKVYIRQCLHEAWLTNGTNCPVIITAYKMRCRRPTLTGVLTSISDQAPPAVTPYVDPTTSSALRRYFRIVGRKRKVLQPSQSTILKMKYFFRGGRPITGDIEGNTTSYLYTTMTTLWQVFVESVPLEESGSGITVTTAPVKVNYIERALVTYYLDEDNDPSSTVNVQIGTIATGFRTFTDDTLQTVMTDQP